MTGINLNTVGYTTLLTEAPNDSVHESLPHGCHNKLYYIMPYYMHEHLGYLNISKNKILNRCVFWLFT